MQPTPRVHSHESPSGGRARWLLSRSASCRQGIPERCLEVSDWPAVQRGLAPRQAGNSAVMGFSSSCHPTQALPCPLLDTAGGKELLAVLSAHPRVPPAELLAAVSVLLCPWSSCSLVFEKFP